MHREMLLSATYSLGIDDMERNRAADSGNLLLWRANVRRLDIEALRDSLLQAAGTLELKAGGPPVKLDQWNNNRRTVYCFVSRRKLDGTLSLFDFPVANDTSEQRVETNTPLQRLFFLNSPLALAASKKVAERLLRQAGEDAEAQIRLAYRLIFSRAPSPREVNWGRQFLAGGSGALAAYAQALFCANEFQMVN